MTVVETLLVFLVAPLAFSAVVAALVMLPALKNRDRYKPGKPWDHAPVWYEPHQPGGSAHDEHDDDHSDDHATMTAGVRASALAIGQAPHAPAEPPVAIRTASGGARGTW